MMMMMNIFNDGTGHSTMHLFNRTAPMSFLLSPPSVYTRGAQYKSDGGPQNFFLTYPRAKVDKF